MEGCPVYASIVTLRPEQENTNFYSSKQQNCLDHKSHFTAPRQPYSYLQNMFHNSIRGPKQVNPRDATHLRVYSTRRQVLLSQTWKQHLQSDTHRGPIWKLHRITHIPGRENRGTTLKLLLKDTWYVRQQTHKHFVGLLNIRRCSRTQTQHMSSIRSKPE